MNMSCEPTCSYSDISAFQGYMKDAHFKFEFRATNLRRDSLLFDGGQKKAAHPTCFARELPRLKLIAEFRQNNALFQL